MNRFETPSGWLDSQIRIDVIGCGGTGSAFLDELFRMHSLLTRLYHPGLSVRAWDADEVSESNVGRQRFWPADVGHNKAELIVGRYNNFGGTRWEAKAQAFRREDLASLHTDLLVTCVDNADIRVEIGAEGRELDRDGIWLDLGNDVDSGQVVLGHLCGGSEELGTLPNVTNLYPNLSESEVERGASCSTEEAILRQDFGINQRVAAEGSGLLWQLIRHGGIERHGSFVYLRSGEVIPLMIDKEVWRTFDLSAG